MKVEESESSRDAGERTAGWCREEGERRERGEGRERKKSEGCEGKRRRAGARGLQ